MIKNTEIWAQWDSELRQFGTSLLAGSVASASLPPIPGIIALVTIVYVGITTADPKADELFSERRDLLKKEKANTLSRKEAEKLDRLIGDLRRTNKTRDTRVFWISWGIMTITLLYLFYKLAASPVPKWFL